MSDDSTFRSGSSGASSSVDESLMTLPPPESPVTLEQCFQRILRNIPSNVDGGASTFWIGVLIEKEFIDGDATARATIDWATEPKRLSPGDAGQLSDSSAECFSAGTLLKVGYRLPDGTFDSLDGMWQLRAESYRQDPANESWWSVSLQAVANSAT